MESGDSPSISSYLPDENRLIRNRRMRPERDIPSNDNQSPSNGNRKKSFHPQPRLPKPRKSSIGNQPSIFRTVPKTQNSSPNPTSERKELSMESELKEVVTVQDEESSFSPNDSPVVPSEEPNSLRNLVETEKKARIPADTPVRSPTSSEDDSLRSAESQDKEASPVDEYLAITVSSTPSETNVNVREELSARGSKAKSSFIRKWTKKMAGSLTKATSSTEKVEVDEEKLVEGGEVGDGSVPSEMIVTTIEDEVMEPVRIHKKRRNTKPKSKELQVISSLNPNSAEGSLTQMENVVQSPRSKRDLRRREKAGEFKPEEKLLGVKIHHSDLLPNDPHIRHPVVRLTIMDQEGNYFRKNGSERSDKTELPKNDLRSGRNYGDQVMTQPFHIGRSGFYRLLPKWEEMFIIPEPLEKFLSPDANAIFFFEIMDFLPMSHESLQRRKYQADLGWHKVAWAFLKPFGTNGTTHVNRKLRLQLYRPHFGKGQDVFSWWKSKKWLKLNSTLHVTIKGVLPPEQISESNLSKFLNMPTDELAEALIEGQLSSGKDSKPNDTKVEQEQARNVPQWRRLPGQSCKVPNHLLASLPTSEADHLNIRVAGSVQCVKFSPCGSYLAAGLDAERYFVILIFEIPSGILLKNLMGHHSIIYDLDWKALPDAPSSYLIGSASADSMTRVWDLDLRDAEVKANLRCVLLHPSYVYCLEFSPSTNTSSFLLATGCFDSVIRIWELPNARSINYSLLQKSSPLFHLDGHVSHVNAVRFHPSGEFIFSGDGRGKLCQWNVPHEALLEQPKPVRETKLSNHEVPITSISVDATGRKLLVQCRQSCLKILDVASFLVLNTFKGHLNERMRIQSVLSPCGNLVLCGSEDSSLYVWDTDTGRLLTQLRLRNNLNCVVASVAYHPFDHYVAIGLFSPVNEPHPILLYTFEYPRTTSMRTVANLKRTLGGRSTEWTEDDGKKETNRPSIQKESDISAKFQSILQKLDEVTNMRPELRTVTAQLMNQEV